MLYTVTLKGATYVMEGGSAHGISKDARFSIFASTTFTDSDTPLATMTASNVGPFSTDLSFTQPSSEQSLSSLPASSLYAFQTSMGEAEALRLHVPVSQEFLPVMQALANELVLPSRTYPHIRAVNEAEADLSTRMNQEGAIEYLIRPESEPVRRLYYTTKAEVQLVQPVLRAAARFFWHLNRTPSRRDLRKRVRVEAYELQEDIHGELDDQLCAPYVEKGKNLCHDGIVEVKADNQTVYGLRVTNELGVALYIWAFYFDCGDLSICECIVPLAIYKY